MNGTNKGGRRRWNPHLTTWTGHSSLNRLPEQRFRILVLSHDRTPPYCNQDIFKILHTIMLSGDFEISIEIEGWMNYLTSQSAMSYDRRWAVVGRWVDEARRTCHALELCLQVLFVRCEKDAKLIRTYKYNRDSQMFSGCSGNICEWRGRTMPWFRLFNPKTAAAQFWMASFPIRQFFLCRPEILIQAVFHSSASTRKLEIDPTMPKILHTIK